MKIIVVILFIGLLAVNACFFLIRPKRPWLEKLTIVFEIVGIYTLGFGILAQTDLFKGIEGLGEQMTSSNLMKFVAGNLRYVAIIFSTLSVALDTTSSGLQYLLEIAIVYVFYLP